MTAREVARSRAYALFAALFREGLTPPLRETVARLPVLAAALPPEREVDVALAEHHALFGLRVFPYGGVFLEPDGRVGGPSADVVRRVAAASGLAPVEGAEAADHLPAILDLLASLGGSDAGAGALARELLGRHLLWWLPPFVVAVREEGDPFWTLAAELTLELAADHHCGLGGPLEGPGPLTRPEPPDPSWSSRLDELARYLATPARSGLYLGSGLVRRMGRRLGLPSGFGSRERLVASLLRSAAEYDGLPPVLAALRESLGAAREHHTRIAHDAPELGVVAAAWLARLDVTETLLDAARPGVAGRG